MILFCLGGHISEVVSYKSNQDAASSFELNQIRILTDTVVSVRMRIWFTWIGRFLFFKICYYVMNNAPC